MATGKDDLTTLMTPHVKSLRATQPDATTALSKNIPTVRADLGSKQKDVDTDFFLYLQSHA